MDPQAGELLQCPHETPTPTPQMGPQDQGGLAGEAKQTTLTLPPQGAPGTQTRSCLGSSWHLHTPLQGPLRTPPPGPPPIALRPANGQEDPPATPPPNAPRHHYCRYR